MTIKNELLMGFIRSGSEITIEKGPYPEVVISGTPHPKEAIIISGNESGFKSLMELLCCYINELEDIIPVSKLPFVISKTPFPFYIELDEITNRIQKGIIIEKENKIIWQLTPHEINEVISSLHGLGYAWYHLHFDPGMQGHDCGVYCYIK